MKRYLALHILTAIALFFLLLTGEQNFHSQKNKLQISSESLTEYFVDQHKLKGVSAVKKVHLVEADIFSPLLNALTGVQKPYCLAYLEFTLDTFRQVYFYLDKRKNISQLLFPFHFFW